MSRRVILDSSLRIPIKEYKNKQWFKQMVIYLTRSSVNFYSKDNKTTVKKFYEVDGDYILVPRFYCPIDSEIEIVNKQTEGHDIDITSYVVPRNQLQIDSIDWFVSNDCGILCLNPGEGKTEVAIDAICKTGKKTIIIVHKNYLVKQWIDRFFLRTNITENQITRLTTKTYKKDFGCDIIVSTVQTICSLIKKIKTLREVISDSNFGMAIWDECHTSAGASEYSKSSLFIPAKRVFGLSATPSRLDNNDDIIGMHLGEIFTPDTTDSAIMDPRIIMLKFDHGVSGKENWICHMTPYDRKTGKYGRMDKVRYLTSLIKSKKYIDTLRAIIKQVDESDRNMLCLSDRIHILDKSSQVVKRKKNIGFFLPREKKKQAENLYKKMVFSTYQSCRDGIDRDDFDCLVMATAVYNLKQTIGRVTRFLEGKKQPIVFDIVDTGFDRCIDASIKRLDFYRSHGWHVEEKVLKGV